MNSVQAGVVVRRMPPVSHHAQPPVGAASPNGVPVKILWVEGPAPTANPVAQMLGRNGFAVSPLKSLSNVEVDLRASAPDVLVIPYDLPPDGGLGLCGLVRSCPRTAPLPVVLVFNDSADGVDKAAAIERGADDCLATPHDDRLLVARLRALARRSRAAALAAEEVLRVGRMTIDPRARQVTYDAAPVGVTATEFRILQLLAHEPGRVHPRNVIAASSGNVDAEPLDRTVDAHIKSIRKKLGAGAVEIETVRGFGYRMRPPR